MPQNKAWTLASYPTGWVTEANFKLVESPAPAPKEGAGFLPPVTAAPGMETTGWQNGSEPALNGLPLGLDPFETSRSQDNISGQIANAQGGAATQQLLQQFTAPNVVEQSYANAADACAGNAVVHLFCSVKNVVGSAVSAIGGFISTIWGMWRFMIGMTGDFFFTAFTNPLLPSSTSAGLFFFVIREIGFISPFIILVTLTTVIEIILTVTTYRSISLLIGGEAEIIGLTKVV